MNWSSQLLYLSKKELKCSIAFAYTKDISGKIKMVIDANNNHDFSDDKIFAPVEKTSFTGLSINDPSLVEKSIIVKHERELNNEIIEETVPLAIIHLTSDDILLRGLLKFNSLIFI